jgi:hypothetical protein
MKQVAGQLKHTHGRAAVLFNGTFRGRFQKVHLRLYWALRDAPKQGVRLRCNDLGGYSFFARSGKSSTKLRPRGYSGVEQLRTNARLAVWGSQL